MSRTPHFDKNGMKKGPWNKEEDDKLRAYIERYGHWNWREIPRFAGVSRCGKSCRLRWMNYLRPNLKHGNFTEEEEDVIIKAHNKIGNKWSTIAAKLPGRSDNEIKNYWNTHLRKRAKNVDDETLESPMKNPEENSEPDEIEALWASLSSELSSASHSSESLSTSPYSSSAELTSSMFSVSDCLVSNGDSMPLPTYCNEYDGSFWTEPFLADYDNTRSTKYSSDLDVVDSLMAEASCHEMSMSDEFLWSTMDLYSKHCSQFMK